MHDKTKIYHLKENTNTLLPEDETVLEINNKNDALLNIKHNEKFVRDYCEKILKPRKNNENNN
jgi:hypothetical protein